MPRADALAVVDASVVVRWLVEEIGSAEATALLDDEVHWLAPRLMSTEVASALRRKNAEGLIRADAAMTALRGMLGLVHDGDIELVPDESLVEVALALAMQSGHKLPDCLYLALAEQRDAKLVTADRRLESLARSRKIASILVPSA